MKRLVFLLLIILGYQSLTIAQKTYRKIDKHALATPGYATTSVERLAVYLTAEADDDAERARAIYIWITNNIAYSDTTITNGWLGTPENAQQQQAAQVLKNRAAVCEGFANLYKALCEAAGLRAEVVTGAVKEENGTIADVGHAWNAVEVAGEWYLTDPTWGSGYADYWRPQMQREFQNWYFLITGQEMIETHLPDDPIWQLLENPLTEQEFRSLSAEALATKFAAGTSNFAYSDTIAQWFRQDSLERMRVASERILRYNPSNSLALARLGNHFYNQALTNFYHAEETVLEALEQMERPLDTVSLLRQLEQAALDLDRGWRYYSRVDDQKLESIIASIPPKQALFAEFDYLRGMMRAWQVVKLYTQIDYERRILPADLSKRMQDEAAQAFFYFAKAKAVFGNYEGELYEEAVVKVKLHEALVYNHLAKAESFVLHLSEKSDEADLQAGVTKLDRAEAYYNRMEAIGREVLELHPGSPLALSFTQEYPRAMAALQLDRGHVYLALLGKRYARQWEAPEQISRKTADQMTKDYEACDAFHTAGNTYLEDCQGMEGVQEIAAGLRAIKVQMHAMLGDIQMYYVSNELNNISTEAAFRKQQPGYLKIFDQVLKHYQAALELSDDNPTLQKYMQETIADIRSRRARIASY